MYRIPKKSAAPTNNTATTTAAAAATATTTTTDSACNGKRKRSAASREKRKLRGIELQATWNQAAKQRGSEQVNDLKKALETSQHEAAVQHAAAQRAEQQRQWAVKAGTAELVRMERELQETEGAALCALEAYERADKQRTELYYQAKSSNALAAKTLMDSLSGAGGETCKALAKQRKVQVVEQAKALRIAVKPHLTAAVQGHAPLPRP